MSLLWAAQAAAQSRGLGPDAPPMAAQRYAVGVQLYAEGRHVEAAREFRTALELLPRSSQIAFNLARCLERAGDLQEAFAVYGRYLELETDAAERAQVERVRAVIRQTIEARTARLEVSSTPAGALLTVDGRAHPTRTPTVVEVSPGRHTVTLRLGGFVDDERVLETPARATVALDVELDRVADWRVAGGWTALGMGAAGLVVGGIFHVQAAGTADAGASLGNGRQRTAEALQSDLETEQAVMWVGYGLGAALLATGAAMLAWPTDGGGVSAGPSEGGAGVTWRARW